MKAVGKRFFILGVHRSGTTLLETMLDQNSAITVCHEISSARTLWRLNAIDTIRDRWKGLLVLNYFYNKTKHLDNPINHCLACQALAPLNYPIKTKAWFDLLIRNYLNESHGSIFGEKTPENTFFIPSLSKVFPDSNYVVIIRNPFDIILSLCEIATIKLQVPIDENLLLRFAALVKRGLHELYNKKRLGAENTLWITYENMVSNPEETLKSICQFLSVEYENQMLKFQYQKKYQSDHDIMKLVHGKLDKPITQEGIGRSFRILTAGQIALLYKFLTPEIYLLPYEYDIKPVALSVKHRLQLLWAKFSFNLHLYQIEELKNKIRFQLHYYAIRFLHNTPLKSFVFKNLIYKKEQWEDIIAQAQASR